MTEKFKFSFFLLAFVTLSLSFLDLKPAAGQRIEMHFRENQNIITAREAFQSGDLDKALRYFQRALERDNLTVSEQVTANNGMCASLMYMERYVEAIERCEVSLELNPNKWETLNNLGISYLGLGDYQKAIFFLEKGLEMNGNSKVLASNLAIAEQRLEEQRIRLQIEREKQRLEEKDNGP